MKVIELYIGSTPGLLIGEKSENVFLYVHGLHGRKEEVYIYPSSRIGYDCQPCQTVKP